MNNRIRDVRKLVGITQEQLAKSLGINRATLSRYENGEIDPPSSQLQRIAVALGVSAGSLLDSEKYGRFPIFWRDILEHKLSNIGYSIGFYEEDAMIWIEYPDGTLEVTENELQELNTSTDSYLRFKLQELKEKHPENFRTKYKE